MSERDEKICDECGGPNPAWAASHLTWFEATGVPEGEGGGVLCPPCFVAKWSERQGVTVMWELRPSPRSARLRPYEDRAAAASALGWSPTPASLAYSQATESGSGMKE